MGEIDVTQMKFLREPGHFADLWNGTVYRGVQVVKPEELVEISPVGLAKRGKKVSKKTSDMVMAKTAGGQVLRVMITENQTEIDYSIPVRVHLREFMEYDKQVAEIVRKNKESFKKGENTFDNPGEYMYGFRESDRLRPVATLVLYWNNDIWKGAGTFHEMLDFSGVEEMKDLVPDFRMNIVNMDKLEDLERVFTDQDVKDVVSLFQARSDKTKFKSYVDEHGKDIHSESMEMVNTLIKSAELQNYMMENKEKKGDDADMCSAITELIEDGRAEGRVEGRVEGRAEGEELVINLLAKLSSLGKNEDVSKCIMDPEYREKMYIAYGFKKEKDGNLK